MVPRASWVLRNANRGTDAARISGSSLEKHPERIACGDRGILALYVLARTKVRERGTPQYSCEDQENIRSSSKNNLRTLGETTRLRHCKRLWQNISGGDTSSSLFSLKKHIIRK